MLWSIEPDRTWAYLNRGLVYLALALVGLGLGVYVPRATGLGVRARRASLALPLGWALLGKAVPALGWSGRIARLSSPIGYWNALALLLRFGAAAGAVAGGAARAPALAARGRRRLPLRAGRRAAADLLARRRARRRDRASESGSCSAGRGWRARRRCCSAAARRSGSRSGRSRGRGWRRTGRRTRCASATALVRASCSCSAAIAVAALAYLGSLAEERRPLSDRAAAARSGGSRWPCSSLGVAVAVVALVVETKPQGWFREFTRSRRRLADGRPGAADDVNSSSRWQWWKEAWHAFEDAALARDRGGDVRADAPAAARRTTSSSRSRTTCRCSS